MPKICYVNRRFSKTSLSIIEKANEIISEYEAQGFDLNLRQLYYQFVARDLIPNSLKSYKNLGSIINDGRLAGLIDWMYITDRTRNLRKNSHWETPHGVIQAAAESYRIDMWARQPYRPEVWIEKDALVGVIEGICEELDVPYFSCRGYTSQSEMWRAAVRLRSWANKNQNTIILHFGDHDPSGQDMTRDIQDRLRMFNANLVVVDRMALNMNQIEKYNPPPNPAKTTDSRYQGYIAEFGEDSWELDALEPQVISDLIRKAISKIQKKKIWKEDLDRWKKERGLLRSASEHWDRISKHLEENGEA